jgi:hypothetical protein
MVGLGEEWKSYRGSKTALSLVAFYADCRHEVLRVKPGYQPEPVDIAKVNRRLTGDEPGGWP